MFSTTLTLDTSVLLLVALMNGSLVLLNWNTNRLARKSQEDAAASRIDMAHIKEATDGLTKSLVAASAKEAHAEGLKEGKEAGEEKAATLAAGIAQGKQTA